MFNIDDETADEMISRLDAINTSDMTSEKLFKREVIRQMKSAFTARPLLMCIALYIYRGIYLALLYLASKHGSSNLTRRSIARETLRKFRFASEFGRLADAAGRAWFFKVIQTSKMNKIDAAYLTWSGVIRITWRKINLSRWDSISGYFLMAPLVSLFTIPTLICLCNYISPITKAFQVTGYLALIFFLFNVYKSMSFDVYKVASKYYVTNSWFGEPSLR